MIFFADAPTGLAKFVFDHFSVFMAIAFGWNFAIALVSILYRKKKGKPFFATIPEGARFVKKRASGRSNRNLLAKLGGADKCLLVVVTNDALIVCPHFPFTLSFLPEMFGLEGTIPKSAIRQVTAHSGLFGSSIGVEFEDPASGRGIEKLELRLRSPEDFQRALAEGTPGSPVLSATR